MNFINSIQQQQFSSNIADLYCSQTNQGSPYFDNFMREQSSHNILNSSSSNNYIRSNKNWEQQEIDDFFENFNKYIFIKFGNNIPIEKESIYNGSLLNIFEKIRKEDSAKKRMNILVNLNNSSSRINDFQDGSNVSPCQLSNNQNTNVIYNHMHTEQYDLPCFSNGLQQISLQEIRRIRTQSCDTDETKLQQQQFGQNQFTHNLQQQQIPQNIHSNQEDLNKMKQTRNRLIQNQFPSQKQEKEAILIKQNNYIVDNPNQQSQNITQQKIQNSTSHNNQKNPNLIGNSNTLFISKQETKPRSITVNVNQICKNSASNLNNVFHVQQYEVDKENISPNLIQQNISKEADIRENLKLKINNIQSQVNMSKADFMNRLYQNMTTIQQNYQGQMQNQDIPPLSQSKPSLNQGVQAQQKMQSTQQTFNESFRINQNTIENPIIKLSNNYSTRGSNSVNQVQNNQILSNNKNEQLNNRNHINNKFKVFVGKKPQVEKVCNYQIAGQQVNQNTISNFHLTEQQREKMKKQWEQNRDNTLAHQQNLINNKNQNRNSQKQYISIPQQQQINHTQQVQQQQIPLINNQQAQIQMQYKYIKRIY